ncbi:LPS export ABC transporter periplasmic protein LptC [Hydromonas duriensis]|uniref:LPS export ABC transporter protein LptC n=1 Tax=Hydromonas duriensis TaxID=1527608 RepID=A0A4V3DJP1_9BURK|nr:LPS export ABC transporter periplasmic protein LptC [Hydromonas duriensis]TDR30810.1 LPS export ABC transporter protein LptC [Hydromonas duriensis]
MDKQPLKTTFSRWRYWTRFHLPNLIYLLILIVVAAGSYWWIKKDSETEKPAKEHHPELADAFTSGMQINRTGKNGAVEYVVTAKEVVHFGDKNAELKEVTVAATPIGQPTSTARADTATWSDETHVIDLKGHVVMNRLATPETAPLELTTEAMTIGLYSNIASSDDAFVLTRGQHDSVKGRRFSYDYASRDLMMGGNTGERISAVLQNIKNDPTK